MNLIKNVVLASVLGSGMCMAQNVQSVTPAIPVDKTIEANIQKWLNKMTLECNKGHRNLSDAVGTLYPILRDG